ncbi:MAG: DNA-directed RNA polymerase subunit beta [Planctomycetota bacterium]|nr:MAG: DNA-directed RNA polymerase subunit beta [Planctomycetota bacterium]REJ97185.1 MAG: DNA-directed RNA polymerase subunit beta [Planctomycetota bacterium]REK27994.1 MAG: DNA-directed RNA polymerase subunit beta [Planctomycetota bacterium]REK48689.1 MAG: DNA-directed RNA polymerase subunit beta [Planctomycetota bacterium]
MATTDQRRLNPTEVRRFGSRQDDFVIPALTEIQTVSFERFLQYEVASDKRKDMGLEGVLQEIFPIESYDKTLRLEYLRYELGKPRYEPDECRQLRLTYGRPFRVWLRLTKEEPIEEEVYLGDMPIMLGGGEFIINGAERVVVSQLHRSPGVDFVREADTSDRLLHSCRIIPERGSWIELNVGKKDTLAVRIDQSGRFSAMTLLRAMDPKYSLNSDIIKSFYKTSAEKIVDGRSASKVEGKIAVDDIVYPAKSDRAGEVIVESGHKISKNAAETICTSGLTSVQVMPEPKSMLIFNSLAEDNTSSHEEALLRIYQRLRPGNPPQLEKAKALFAEKFYDTNRYRLGKVGRFRINRKLGLKVPDSEMTLRPEDLLASIRYLIQLVSGDARAEVDDIDHLGNRRLRTIDELACDEMRKGFLKLRRTVQERMSLKDVEEMTPRSLVNPKSISAAIEYFFGRGELSQVVDQTNPLSMLTHERRLSALGPGGLNRKRAGFEVRDVHISHYGRICPIETPEGTNIGLISSLAMYSAVDEYGFLVTPYRKVSKGKLTNDVVWLRADEEAEAYVAPADAATKGDKLSDDMIIARRLGDFESVSAEKIQYIDVAPSQMVGVSAGLIPFLEHDDANRALMGSNMQRQAVPLLVTEPPIVGTGLEKDVATNSSMVIRARKKGTVTYVDGSRMEIGGETYQLRKFVGLNERTCQNQKPLVSLGQKVEKGDVIADGAATFKGELALGRNVLVAFMAWDGYNFEDAIIISEELVQDDAYTSIHIEEFDIEIRETKLGREEFTRDIPNVSEKALQSLDESGIVQIGTYVRPGDILVGKVSPKSKTELTPEEKLLHAIFGRAGEDVKNDSLEVPSGVEGIVIDTQKFSRRMSLSDDERKLFEKSLKEAEAEGNAEIAGKFGAMIGEMETVLGRTITDEDGTPLVKDQDPKFVAEQATRFKLSWLNIRSSQRQSDIEQIYDNHWATVEAAIDDRDRRLNSMKRGDELRSGVLQMVKVYIATKRVISTGDKMAGRHGNKGVIARILPREDMPFLADGTPVQIMLNPLGVPSRMNVGQILETHLGWAGAKLGFQAITPVFDGATEETIHETLRDAGLPETGKVQLFDGRTGEPLEQETTVGYIYMLKLHHLVDEKVHARSTGPYSLITQQPLGGKARFGGQRFGEMEVWALEAYGAAYILQELLTVKSDDVEGRTKIYESMVKGENTLEAGTPASFDVLTNEIRGLGLNMQLEKRRI